MSDKLINIVEDKEAREQRLLSLMMLNGFARSSAEAIDSIFVDLMTELGEKLEQRIEALPERNRMGALLFVLRGLNANLSQLENDTSDINAMMAMAAGVPLMTNGKAGCDCYNCRRVRAVNEALRNGGGTDELPN